MQIILANANHDGFTDIFTDSQPNTTQILINGEADRSYINKTKVIWNQHICLKDGFNLVLSAESLVLARDGNLPNCS